MISNLQISLACLSIAMTIVGALIMALSPIIDPHESDDKMLRIGAWLTAVGLVAMLLVAEWINKY